MLYTEAREILEKQKARGHNRKKLASNTYLELRENGNDNIAIKFYDTDIIVLKGNGDIVLSNGGYATPTTKSRINEYLPVPWTVYQEASIWYLTMRPYNVNPVYVFIDGITIHNNNTVEHAGCTPDKELPKRINKYAKSFAAELVAGNVPAPGHGDCFGCTWVTDDGKLFMDPHNHLGSHIEEDYFVPRLLINAIRAHPECMSRVSRSALSHIWHRESPIIAIAGWEKSILEQDVKNVIRKYMRKELGLAG